MTPELLRKIWKRRYVDAPNRKFLEYFASVWPSQELDFLWLQCASDVMTFDSEDHRAAWIAVLLWDAHLNGSPIFWACLPRELEDRAVQLQSEFQKSNGEVYD